MKLKARDDGYRNRAPYFHYYRSERQALKVLEQTYTQTPSKREYRACRYLYYQIVPLLAGRLWFPPDRVRLQEVEHQLYNEMLSHKFRVGGTGIPKRVFLRLDRIPPSSVDKGPRR